MKWVMENTQFFRKIFYKDGGKRRDSRGNWAWECVSPGCTLELSVCASPKEVSASAFFRRKEKLGVPGQMCALIKKKKKILG